MKHIWLFSGICLLLFIFALAFVDTVLASHFLLKCGVQLSILIGGIWMMCRLKEKWRK